MLNISPNSIRQHYHWENLSSFRTVESRFSGDAFIRLILITVVLFIIMLFLPWTQNIQSRGTVTTLRPEQRPQTIHSVIAGRIEKWYVREGSYVEKGDTILHLSEIKDEYLDPDLLQRTIDQVNAKGQSAYSYQEKANALDDQIRALEEARTLKLAQAENKLTQAKLKVESDSSKWEAASINVQISKDQLDRIDKLFRDGLKSKTEWQKRELALQKSQADLVASRNDFLKSKNDLINAQVELSSIRAEYQDKIAKARSDKFEALSGMYEANAVVTKLQNQYENYAVRNQMYYVLAPQNGMITKTMQSGIGETIKEGEEIASIAPQEFELAIEMYVKPVDVPLLDPDQEVRIQFDGWPAIVFSGWPNSSFGTYGGKVWSVDNFIIEGGLYRVIVTPDPDLEQWPEELRIGAGTRNMVLLKEVPIWYELWRKLNGFPPDYYKSSTPEKIVQ
jgi:multidrug efflux pump subunit AcrA (membrane-fusion protein)